MILTGDIGGTKTTLALYRKNADGSLECNKEQTFASADYPQFDDILSTFIAPELDIASVCLGIAGPIV
ncbi:MAG: glucokinase, partial [Methylococcales bacterium]|nr:glucokinase [Methylococcales bacterium]